MLQEEISMLAVLVRYVCHQAPAEHDKGGISAQQLSGVVCVL